MAINSKPYMNFLGGEVSPNAYKRLDMANNGKWFETAKNIYFGTTGDFHNRRGFKRVSETASGISGEKIKLIPFVFNKENSYCIEFNSNTFRILKNSKLLKDANDNIINIRHDGVLSDAIDDISYAQVGDILYIATGGTNRIYTITRLAEKEWKWEEFDYSIPPMRSVNIDEDKSLLFSENTTYGISGQFQLDVSSFQSTLNNIVVSIKENDTWTNIYTANTDFASWDSFVIDFNANQTASTKISSCRVGGNVLTFYCTSDGSLISSIKVTLGQNTRQERVYNFGFNDNGFLKVGSDGGNAYGYRVYYFSSSALVKSISVARRASQTSQTSYFSKEYLAPTFASPSQAASDVSAGGTLEVLYDSTNQRFLSYRKNSDFGPFGAWITSIVALEAVGQETVLETSTRIAAEVSQGVYDVYANFDFFNGKEVGEIFSVDSIFSPSKYGKAGENKSYFGENLSSGSFSTDAFWSNGNWRFVTSGLFEGNIELQYSYDNANWYTHRTFSSSIRTESGVSYGTNYNEYGTIEADDNILLRLKISITSTVRFSVLLDTESFKNRSYYRILEKDSVNPGRTVIAKCIQGSIGTPGITRESADPSVYDINRIYEWAEAAWSYKYGYPKIVFLYQNRLAFANTEKDPQTIWFSRVDNFKDFSTEIEYVDDDPITISVLKPTGISQITGIAASRKLFVFTGDREYGIKDEGALTQANKELVSFSTYGSEPVETRVVSNRVVFVEEGARAARSLVYDYSQDNYEAHDLTIPFKHLLTDEVVVATEYLPGEYKCYLMLTSSGRLILFKYIPEQHIEACSWFKHAVGNITNICVVAKKQAYDLYICMDDGTNKFIECMEIVPYQDGVYLDSYKEYWFSSQVSSITDNSYLKPNTNYVVFVNNTKYNLSTDAQGVLTLPAESDNAVVGFVYDSEATLIEPNFNMQNGTTNYNRKNLYKAHFTFMDSDGFKVGVKNKERSFKQMLHISPENKEKAMYPREGERSFIIQSSYLEPNMLSFVQEEPRPMHITNAEVEVDYGGK